MGRCRYWLGMGMALVAPAWAQGDDLAVCRDVAAEALPAVARDALPRIDGVPRQLLALRSYLRTRDLPGRWSWSQARIQDYQGSPEQQRAQAEVAKVQARFAEQNPGFSLQVNLQVRSLDEQLDKWNRNASVAAAATQLASAADAACRADRPQRFAVWLRAWAPDPAPNLAAPGLSSHGQGRAYDFQVLEGTRLVAGTDAARLQADWIEAGWAARLAQAVHAASDAFEGPLRSPEEPWHYTYVAPAAR